MRGFPITFNIYAESEAEVERARQAIVGFINAHAAQGRAVTAAKIAEAVANWDRNAFVRNRINDYFK